MTDDVVMLFSIILGRFLLVNTYYSLKAKKITICEYSLIRIRGEHSFIFTEPEANNSFSILT